MSFIVVGTNHKFSPLPLRENLFFSRDRIYQLLDALFKEKIVNGAVILSTCQRTEIYAQDGDPYVLAGFLSRQEVSEPLLRSGIYIKHDADAVFHLFNVAAGLDSSVLGEDQILHQVKEAYFLARGFEATTSFLNRVFERSLFVGKTVRRNVTFFKGPASIASIAVEKAESFRTSLRGKNIFVIGSGKVAHDVARSCFSRGANRIIVAGRNILRAKELAAKVRGRAITISEFTDMLPDADIVFSATASPGIILRKEVFENKRAGLRPLLIFDLGMPRDIDPLIGTLRSVYLFNLDEFLCDRKPGGGDTEGALRIVREKTERFLWKLGAQRGLVLQG